MIDKDYETAISGASGYIEALECSHALEILMYIACDSGVCKHTVAREIGKNTKTVFQRIDRLIEAGLLSSTRTPRNNSYVLSLTRDGERIAEGLLNACKKIGVK